MVYVDDVDEVFVVRSTQARRRRPVEGQFYGDRAGQFTDPFGRKWFIATHVEDIAPDKLSDEPLPMQG